MNQNSFIFGETVPALDRGAALSLCQTLVGRVRLAVLAWAAILSCASVRAADTNAPAPPPGWLTQPMSLADAVTVALLHNSSIRKGQSDLQAAHGVVVQTRAVAVPKIRGASGYAHNEAIEEFPFSGPNRVNPPKDEWSGSIRMVQNIYEGGRIRSALRRARLTTEQALLQYQAVVADTVLDVRRAYYDALLAEQEILVREASVGLLAQELTNTTHRFDSGTVPRFDVLRGEVEVANARPKLIRARNAWRVAKNNLANLLGYDVPASVWEDIPLTLTGKLAAEPYRIGLPAALAQALERRPELGVLRTEEGLRQESIVAAKSAYKPVLGVFAGYGAHSSSFQNDLFRDVSGPMAGVQLSWDLYDGGATKGKVMEARAYYEKAGFALQEAVRRVQLEVRTAYSTLLEAREVLESQKKVQEQAEEALRLAVARYDAGTGTQLDVLNAQTALTEARTTQIEALRNYAVARARLDHAIGADVPQPSAQGPGTARP